MSTQTIERDLSDVFVDVPRAEYAFVKGTLTNNTGAAVDLSKRDLIGYPVKFVTDHYELAIPATDEATVDGLVFDPQFDCALADAGETTEEFVFLIRGPAVVNLDNIVSGFTLATIATALAAKSPPIIRFTSASVTEDATA